MTEGTKPGLLAALQSRADPPGCGLIARAAEGLDHNDFADLLAALPQPEFTAAMIKAELAERGVIVGESTIRGHRRGECRCE